MRWLLFIVLAVLAAPVHAIAAPAGDPSPDPSYRGLWYVIEATPAPWSGRLALTAGQAPLRSYLISFDDGAVTGAAPLACSPALFHFTFVTSATMFDGRLDKAKADAWIKTMGFDPSRRIETQRIFCGGARFDYYQTDNRADLLIAVGDIIYRLRRPEGSMSDLKPGFAGPSFDCLDASRAAEQMICADVHLAGLDRAIGDALKRLQRTETQVSFATVKAAQRDWRDYTVQRCGAGGALPMDSDALQAMHQCLYDRYQDQAPVFADAIVVHVGAGTLEPRARFTTRTAPPRFDMDLYPWLTGAAAAPFNAYVARLLRLDRWAVDDTQYFSVADLAPDQSAWARRTYKLVRFDSRVIGLAVLAIAFNAVGEQSLDELSLNWDVAKGAPIGLADLFRAGSDWQRFVIDYCLTDLTHQFDASNPPPREAVARVVADPGAWLFEPDKASVRFSPGTVAPDAGGEYGVDIPYAALKDYLRPDAAALVGARAK